MPTIFQRDLDRTLDTLVSSFATGGVTRLEAWLFDDEPSRRRAEILLASRGIEAKLHSAYKPLLHFFLEEVDMADLAAAHIRYPVHDAAPRNRFLLEAYPLSALIDAVDVSFEEGRQDALIYDVQLKARSGTVSEHAVFAPNRLHEDFIGELLLSPTGWLAIDGQTGNRLETDYEQLFRGTMDALASHDWGIVEPYFDELSITAILPIQDRKLPVGEEVLSPREALHEDFYFSLLEVFQKRSGRPIGDRGLKPGQIVPDIRYGEAISVVVETRQLTAGEQPAETQPLHAAHAPLSAGQIKDELRHIGGHALTVSSRAGRTVEARYKTGSDKPIMISGGQHANETTGIVGALRAARQLSALPNAHFAVSPLENPDGYQIHWRLRAENPHHMHHAARYTALGDDLEYRSDRALGEKAIRHEAERLSGARLHVNLHGYPSHEWTRPLSGYIPRNFAMWTIPRGFFLIMRHHPDWANQADQVLDHVTCHLAEHPEIKSLNERQIGLFQIYAGDTGFQMINGFPCLVGADERSNVPLTLITEYPDETIYGDAFVAGHTAQMETVLAAYQAAQFIEEPTSMPEAIA